MNLKLIKLLGTLANSKWESYRSKIPAKLYTTVQAEAISCLEHIIRSGFIEYSPANIAVAKRLASSIVELCKECNYGVVWIEFTDAVHSIPDVQANGPALTALRKKDEHLSAALIERLQTLKKIIDSVEDRVAKGEELNPLGEFQSVASIADSLTAALAEIRLLQVALS